MFNFNEALTYIFKEKHWGYKFLIPFGLQLLIVIPSLLITLTNGAAQNNYLNTNNYMMGYNMGYNYSYNAYNTSNSVFSLLFLCIFCFSFIPYIVVNLWYMYENTQAGIQNRETKPIWKNNLTDTLKKSGKYFLVSLFYGFIALIVILLLLGIFCVGMVALTAVGYSSLQASSLQNNIAFFLTSGVGIALLCSLLFVGIALYVIFYLAFTPAVLRLIGSNTFAEGLKVRESWRIGWKYKWRFIYLLCLMFIFAFIFGIFSALGGVVTDFLGQGSTLLNFIFQTLYQIVVAAITTYFAYFVYTRLIGQLFRNIVQDEESLKFIKL